MSRGYSLSKKEVHAIVARLRSGRGSILSEAHRVGCYHATVRKAVRAAIGLREYGRLVAPRRGPAKPTRKAPEPSASRQRGQLAPMADTTCDCGLGTLAGTDGNGIAVLWCPGCGYTERVVRRGGGMV